MPYPFAAISIAAGTTQTVVAAQSGRKIRVVNYTVISDTAGTYKFQSYNADTTTATDLTGAIPVAANGGASPTGAGLQADGLMGLFETLPGESLRIVFSTTANVGGHLAYQIRP